MEPERVEANWLQLKGYLRERWGDLTDDELDQVRGRRDQLVGYLEERTSLRQEVLEREIDLLSRRAQYVW